MGNMRRRSNEPLWWAPFSGGMMADAMVLPALVVITGILIPMGLVSEGLRGLLLHPITRFTLSVIIALTFFHAAHRLRFVLYDLGIRGGQSALAVIMYGAALAGSLAAGLIATGAI